MSQHKLWVITGSSRGFGRIWAEAALRRGDRVAATARDPLGFFAVCREAIIGISCTSIAAGNSTRCFANTSMTGDSNNSQSPASP